MKLSPLWQTKSEAGHRQRNPSSTSLIVDPRLPTLELLFDQEAVANEFAATWHNGSAAPKVRVVKMQHIRYQPGVHCAAVYELHVERSSGALQKTLGVATCLPEKTFYRFYWDDPELPQLATATDVARMSPRLNELRVHMGLDQAGEWEVTPLRYRPGSRCALRYSYETGGAQNHFFAKMFHQADGRRIAAVQACYDTSVQVAALPQLPPLLAYWPDLQMMTQPMIRGIELHETLFAPQTPTAERTQWMMRMGQSMAAFHNLPHVQLPEATWQSDLDTIAAYLPALSHGMPSLVRTFQTALTEVEAAASQMLGATTSVSHGALRTDQFLIAATARTEPTWGGRTVVERLQPQEAKLVLIDLDTLCLAQPERDLGNCLAYLDWKAMRQPEHAAYIADAAESLLSGYAAEQSYAEPRWLALYRAISLLKIAGRRFCNLNFREWPLTPQLVQLARTLLGEVTLTQQFASTLST